MLVLKKNDRKIAFAFIVAAILVVTTFFSMLSPSYGSEKLSDPDTTTSYKSNLGDNSSTRYAGRVWTDKTVYTGNATFTGEIGEVTVENDSDFLVAYSALATSQSITGKSQVPIDVVFVVDNSNSMDESVGGNSNQTRLAATVDAVNSSIGTIMESNENSRVAVVLYGMGAEVLMPLSHYSKMEDGEYLRYTSSTSYGGTSTTFTSSAGKSISMNYSERGTNTQMGVYTGMEILAEATDIETDGIIHMPAMVLLSDGAATSSGAGSWWEPSGQQGSGSYTADAYALKAAMNAQYMKQQVDKHYELSGNSGYSCRIYTVGMGIEQLHETGWFADNTDYYRAQMVLDPGEHLNDQNDVAENIKSIWDSYIGGSNPTMQWSERNTLSYTFNHPDTNDISTIAYNDGYYSAENAEDVAEVFKDITSTIIATAPQAPTQIESGDPLHSGYLTYTDPIGEYMEVKEMKGLIYVGQVFEQAEKESVEGGTKYTFQGTITSPVYGELDAANIEIIVTADEDGNEILTVRIPAAAIPLRVNTVELNSDGAVQSYTDNGAYPARILYTVGVKDEVDISTCEGISDEYIDANMTDDGKVNLFSNRYSGNTKDKSTGEPITVGDARATFVPASTNPFFYVQENTPLYTNEACTSPATGSLDPSQTYYFHVNYYEGLEQKTATVARSGAAFGEDVVKDSGTGGQLEIQKGAPRLGYLDDFSAMKETNSTGTAESELFFTYDGQAGGGDQFSMYLGNNGRLQIDVPKSLTIEKEVTADQGLTAPDEDFAFELVVANKASDEADAVLHKSDGTTESKKLTFNADGKADFALKAGQSLEVLNIGVNTEYTVKEVNIPDGFTANSSEITGSVSETDENNIITFTNNYSVEDIEVDGTSLGLSGTKYIDGDRDFQTGDAFTFKIRASQVTPDAPLPSKQSTTVEPESGNSAEFSFDGSVFTFDSPGQYKYVIEEEDTAGTPAAVPGISYDSTVYRLVVNVVDNGNGTMSVDSKELTKFDDQSGNWVEVTDGNVDFTNTYSINSKTLTLSGTKILQGMTMSTDPDDQFSFVIEAGGSRAVGSGNEFAADDTQPMPENTEVKNLTTGNIIFEDMSFGQATTDKEYKYTIREKQPTEDGTFEGKPLEGAVKNSEGRWVYKGITYDNSEKTIIVTSTAGDDGQGQHAVILETEGDLNYQFTNVYKASGSIELSGVKYIAGREFKDGDTFTFSVKPEGNAPEPEKTQVTINPSSGESAEVNFGTVTFTQEGTYTYKIKESEGSIGGLTYDTAEKTATVKVTDKGDGTMDIEVSYSPGDKLTWTNRYGAVFNDNTAVNLTGTKALTGDSLEAGEFYFIIEPQNGAPMGDGKSVVPTEAGTVQPDGSYKGSMTLLNNIKYEKAGTYQYLIKEQIPANKRVGMTYDETIYRVTVIVTDDLNGNLSAGTPTIEKQTTEGTFEEVQDITFSNRYAPLSTTLTPYKFTKELTGNRPGELQAGEFSFEMNVLEADPEDGVSLPEQTVVSNGVDGSVQFGDITFTKAGTYRVQVREVVPEDKVPGVTYDTHAVTTTFKVVDNEGQLTASRIGTNGATTFINTYGAQGDLSGQTYLKVTKDLEGRSWNENDSFTFTLAAADDETQKAVDAGDVILPDDANGIMIEKATQNHTAHFGDMTVKKAGTYTFIIKEAVPEETGNMTYDRHSATVIVEAVDDAGTGTLDVTATSTGGMTFTNTYTPESIEVVPQGTKVFTGRDVKDSDTFTFNIAKAEDSPENTPMPALASVTVKGGNFESGSNGSEAEISFGEIAYDQAGTYKYVITEEKGDTAGVNYDKESVLMTVKVTYDETTGKFSSDVTYKKGDGEQTDGFTFTNTYEAAPVSVAGFSAQKTVTGDYQMKAGDFSFTFTPSASNPKNDPVQEPRTVMNDADGSVTFFSNLEYTAPGEYNYSVSEVSGETGGIIYDDKVYNVKVDVTDDGNGQLKAEKTITLNEKVVDAITFENGYDPKEASADIQGTKKLTGNKVLEDGMFTFKLSPVGNAPMPKESTTENTAGGVFSFEAITYDRPGTYKYRVSEVKGDAAGYTYDSKAYDVTVTVTDEGGVLKAEVSKGADDIVFNNSYAPAPLDVGGKIGGTKELTGRDLKEGEFVFQLKDAEGNVVSEAKNKADGSFAFKDVTIDSAGTHNYTISEKNNGLGGVEYDGALYGVTVEATDDNGRIAIESIIYSREGELVDKAEFANTYKASGTGVQIGAIKQLEGRDLEEGEFTFVLSDENGNDVSEAVNGADGSVMFDTITYDEPGIYKYEVRELAGDDRHIRYDESVYDVTVTVKDAGKGYLEAAVDSGEGAIVFSNLYDKDEVFTKTGDNTPLAGALALALLALTGAGAVVIRRKLHA